MIYLAYDIRGIQSFIFAIPRLKYVAGGSALIDAFDRETVVNLAREHSWQCIAAAGGKGCFQAGDDRQADEIQARLVHHAHEFGLDIRFGRGRDFGVATRCADSLFPYLPRAKDLDGPPCNASGLYPAPKGGTHGVVSERIEARVRRWFETRLLAAAGHDGQGLLPPALAGRSVAFFRDADQGSVASRSLGQRNRWALICMDGNDLGTQFARMAGAPEYERWLPAMSRALDQASESACLAGMRAVLEDWLADEPALDACMQDGDLLLPLRPLVVGGDDIAVLCHARYAHTFVLRASAEFAEHSRAQARARRDAIGTLWPATGNELSISAGILYAPITLPLASAMGYAEALLANAKQLGRTLKRAGEPAPACVDWESVTEGLLDHPLVRRRRELMFRDGDLGDERVELTSRPYRLADFEPLLRWAGSELRELPGSIVHTLLAGLRAGHDDRQLFYARLGKRHAGLVQALAESPGAMRSAADHEGRGASRWWREQRGTHWVRGTSVIDAVLLLQEQSRSEWETA